MAGVLLLATPALAARELSYVDVYFGQTLVASSLAEFDEDSILFSFPGEFVQGLPSVYQPELVSRYFAAPIAYQDAEHCSSLTVKSCFSDDEVVKLRFDRLNFRAQIYLNPAALVIQKIATEPYLPPADHSLSYLAAVDLLYNQSQLQAADARENWHFSSEQVLSAGNRRLLWNGGLFSSGSGIYTRELNFINDLGGERLRAGRFDISGDFLMQGALITGLSVNSTSDLRLDLKQLGGSSLEVYLPADCRVDVLRNGRLLSSQQYEAGSRELDVERLPEGAYMLRIRAYAHGEVILDEERFFVKSSQLPAPGESYYGFDFGVASAPEDFSLREKGEVMRFSFGHRWRDDRYVAVQSYATLNWQALQGSYQWFSAVGDGALAVHAGDDGYVAYALTWQWSSVRFGNIGVEWYRSQADPEYREEYFRRDANSGQHLNLRYGFSGQNWHGRSQILYRDSSAGRGLSLGASVSAYPFPRYRDLVLGVALGHDRDLGFRGELSLRYYLRGDKHSAWFAAEQDLGRASGSSQHIGIVGSRVDRDNRRLRYELDAEQGRGRENVGASLDYYGSVVDGAVAISQERGEVSASQANLALRSNISLGEGGAQVFAGGGRRAGIVVELSGRGDYPIEVAINDRRIIVPIGTRYFVPLQYYRRYNIQLRVLGGAPVEFSDPAREIVLYPGNVPILRWEAKGLLAVFGRVMIADVPNGAEIELRSSRGRDRTTNGGYFTLDANEGEEISVLNGNISLCTIRLGTIMAEDVVDLGDVDCALGQ